MKDTYKVPKSLKDKLQAAVNYLTEHPEEIEDAWSKTYSSESGCLFRYAHPNTNAEVSATANGEKCGCLLMIKSGKYLAYTPTLTEQIMKDDRLPIGPNNITVAHLPIFQEWMLRLAVEFRWKS